MTRKIDLHRDYVTKLLCEKSLYHFITSAWEYVDPSKFQDNWHIKFLADHLQAMFEDKFEQDWMLINIAPGLGKSLIVSVFLPAWLWINYPETRFLTGSKTEELAIRDARRCRSLLQSEWFQKNWGHKWTFATDENRKRGYENSLRGYRNIFSSNGNVTGKRGNYRIIDDPNDSSEAYNKGKLNSTNEWYSGVFSTRDNPLERTKTIVIMQRIAQGDFSDHILESLGDDILHICLPFYFDPARKCVTPLGEDPRATEGEVIWTAITEKRIETQKKLLGRKFVAEYQQLPAPLEGAIFKSTDFRYYTEVERPIRWDQIITSSDIADKTADNNDNSCISVWGIVGQKKYLLDLWFGKLEYPELRAKFISIADQWKPHANLVEDRANGRPLIQELKNASHHILIPIQPKGAKEARADSIRPEFIDGLVLFPEKAPWLVEYLDELLNFPVAAHDDMVDSTTQLLLYLRNCGYNMANLT